MKNTKKTVYHCYNTCEMFVQFDVSFCDLYLLHPDPPPPPPLVFYHICKNYKIGLDEKWVVWTPPHSPSGLTTASNDFVAIGIPECKERLASTQAMEWENTWP